MSTNLPATDVLPPPPLAYDTIDIRQIMQILRRRAGMIAGITIACTLIALLHVLFAVPQFTANGTLYLGDAQAGGGGGGGDLNFLSGYSAESDVETEIELITAGQLVENAVLETGLNAQISPAGAPKLTFWRWRFSDGGQTSSFTPGPATLQALYAQTPGDYRLVIGQNNSYKLYSKATFLRSARLLLQGQLGMPAAGAGVQMLVQPASSEYKAVPGRAYDVSISSPNALADSLQGGALKVAAGGSATSPTKNAFLTFEWNNPYQAQLFINQVMQDYIATQLSWKTQSASTTEDFVSNQLKNVSASLAEADRNLAAYQSQTGVIDVPANSQTMINQLTTYQQQRATVQLQRDALQQLAQDLKTPNGVVNPYLISETDNTVPAALIDSLSAEQLKLSELRAQYTEAEHDVQVEEAKVSEIKHAISETVANELAAANKNLGNLDQLIGQLQDQTKLMPTESLKIIALQRSSAVLGQLYTLLMEKQAEAQLSKAATIIDTRIVTPAHMPLYATSPKATIAVVFGALIGLIVGIALAFGQRTFSGRFESEEQVRLAVRLPIYGAIPRRARAAITGNGFEGVDYGPFSESFRLLRSSIYRIGEPGTCMVILIISASKSDGKTTVATNLAKSLADNGKKVVLVDGDLHLSRLQGPKSEARPGLTDWITTGTRPAIENWPGENFKILGAGTALFPGRAQLNEDRLQTVFAALREEYDYVILDSPPLPAVSDGLTLGIFADLILSVISVSNTPRRGFNVHNELIDTLGRPHGIIINEVEAEYYGESDAYFFAETARRNKFAGWFRIGNK